MSSADQPKRSQTTSQYDPIEPTRADIDAWRQLTDAVVERGGLKPGQFNWVMVVRSLIAEWEKQHGREAER